MKYETINGWTKEEMKAAIRYLTSDGNRCAVGCFLPDRHPGQSYKGTVIGLLDEYPELKKKMPLSPEALMELQAAHDHYLGTRDLRDVLCEWIDENVVNKGDKMSRAARYKKAMYCAQLLEPRPLRLRDGHRELAISVTHEGQMFLKLPSFITLTQEHALLLRDWITENFEETEGGE